MDCTRLRRLFEAAIFVLAATGSGASTGGAIYKCPDPITKRLVISQVRCDQERSPAEVAAASEADRLAKIAADKLAVARNEGVQLLRLYPDEASLRRAHVADLNEVSGRIRVAMVRFRDLQSAHEQIDSEAEFYKGKQFPVGLQRKHDDNEAGLATQVDIFNGLRSDVANIEARRGLEFARLRSLWAGARSGSTGPLATEPAATPAK